MHIEKVTTVCLRAAPWGWEAALENEKLILRVGNRLSGAGHNGGDVDGDGDGDGVDGGGYQGALVVSHPIEGERKYARLWKAFMIRQMLC